MTDVHLTDFSIASLEEGPLKDLLITTQDDLYFPGLVMALITETDTIRKGGQAPAPPTSGDGGVPVGGVAGQLIVKQSATDGDVAWEGLVFNGGNANG